MADEEDLKILCNGATDLTMCDFRGANLNNLDLSGRDFTGALLDNCIAIETNFNECNFEKASLNHLNAEKSSFCGTHVGQTLIHGLEFRGHDTKLTSSLFGVSGTRYEI